MLFNELPGKPAPYGIRAGQGPRYLLGGVVASVYATPAETSGNFTLSQLTGGKDAGLPMMRHAKAQVAIQVLEGEFELFMEGACWRMIVGDFASIPEGTEYGFRMTRHRNRAMFMQTGDQIGEIITTVGKPYKGFVQPEENPGTWQDLVGLATPDMDTEITGALPLDAPKKAPLTAMPDSAVPYVLESNCGRRLVVADQLFTFMAGNAQSNDRFLNLLTEGPAGQMVPPHKHLLHDEIFFCGQGRMKMMGGDEFLELGAGDFLFVPRTTPHAYQFLEPYTQIMGWLVPGVFEKFFSYLGDPTEMTVYPQVPPAFRFDRVLAHVDELDIVPLGKPEDAKMGQA